MAMADRFFFPVTLVAALGCGLIAGTFFAFSSFVMKAFTALPPEKGIAAMQSVNVTVLNPWFLTIFMGTALACVFALIAAFLRWREPGAVYLLVGGVLYLVGTFLVTAAINVPMNDALAAVKPDSPEGARVWANYLTNWTFWNHVRTVTALAALAAFTLALHYRGTQQ